MQHQSKPDQEQTYTVTIRPINDVTQRKSLQEALARIDEMNKQLEYFYSTISVGYKEATELLSTLQKARLIKEEPHKERTDQSVMTYLDLLHAIKIEIERERVILESLQSAQEEKTIEIYEPAPTNFDDFVRQKIKNTKVQTKKIESSLRVSFSRYQHWINQTITRLNHLQKMYVPATS
ncbi:MAG: hypothetical protein QG604_246 [Candidatus Dependentiae bacterium]|nr:hypothetical protein [Candidatus Dependentiae bacterium]